MTFVNGLGHKTIGMHPGAFRNAIRNAPQPNMVGAGMVLNARGNEVGAPPPATVAKRRARNKAARKARRNGRR